jgi:hypothetical protein
MCSTMDILNSTRFSFYVQTQFPDKFQVYIFRKRFKGIRPKSFNTGILAFRPASGHHIESPVLRVYKARGSMLSLDGELF